MRQRFQLVPAYVLHTRPYRDTSLLVEALTQDQGRVGLITRGARVRQGALLQPFRPILLSWSQQGELGTCQGVESAGLMRWLQGETLFAALYCHELLLKLTTRQDPNPEIWHSYQLLLERLEPTRLSSTLRYFEHDLLSALGYGLDLSVVEVGLRYQFDDQQGLRTVTAQTLTPSIEGEVLHALANHQLTEQQATRLKAVLRQALDQHSSGSHLRTPGVWKALRQLDRSNTVTATMGSTT